MNNRGFLVIILILISVNSYGQLGSSKELVNKFFTTYESNKEKAVRDLYATNKWTETAKEGIEKVVTTVNGFTTAYMGEYPMARICNPCSPPTSITRSKPQFSLHSTYLTPLLVVKGFACSEWPQQEYVVASSNEATGASASLSYSVGQPFPIYKYRTVVV